MTLLLLLLACESTTDTATDTPEAIDCEPGGEARLVSWSIPYAEECRAIYEDDCADWSVALHCAVLEEVSSQPHDYCTYCPINE